MSGRDIAACRTHKMSHSPDVSPNITEANESKSNVMLEYMVFSVTPHMIGAKMNDRLEVINFGP